MLFLLDILQEMSNACQLNASNALFPMILGCRFWIKVQNLAETLSIFRKESLTLWLIRWLSFAQLPHFCMVVI